MALAHLSKLPEGELASAREIADHFNAPAALMMNILKDLSAAELVESVRGARGGYRLARDPEDISVAEVMAVIEGPLRLADCIAEAPSGQTCDCGLLAKCPIAGPVGRINRRLNEYLDHVTLAELLGEPKAVGPDGEHSANSFNEISYQTERRRRSELLGT